MCTLISTIRPTYFIVLLKQKQYRVTLKKVINRVSNVQLPGLHAKEVGQLHEIQIITQVCVYFRYFYLYSSLWNRLFFLLFLTQSILILMRRRRIGAYVKKVYPATVALISTYILHKEMSCIRRKGDQEALGKRTCAFSVKATQFSIFICHIKWFQIAVQTQETKDGKETAKELT